MLKRTNAPKITDAVEFELRLPPFQKSNLSNGVEVYAIDLGEQDTLMLNWIFYAGNYFEEKNLVATTANYLLKNGTSSRNAFSINEHFEYFGSYLSRNCQNETAEITLHCLGKHVDELLPVVAELITDSIFPADELEIYKKNMQQKLQVSLMKSEFVAGRRIEALLFGEKHPYGRYSSLADYAALQQEEVKKFYNQYYKEGRCIIIAAGKLPPNLQSRLESSFGGLSLQAPGRNFEIIQQPILPADEKKHFISNDPNGVQGSIRIARNFPNRHHPDFQKVQVLNSVFGGFFGSRLMTNIREDKGYTYGIYSYLLNLVQQSAFLVSTEAGKEVCRATIDEVYKEMKSLREEPVDEEELQITRNYMIGTILGDLDGPFQVATRWKNILLNKLDANYFYKGVEIIKTITPKELQDLANVYLQEKDFYELVVV
jgi:zinc protease